MHHKQVPCGQAFGSVFNGWRTCVSFFCDFFYVCPRFEIKFTPFSKLIDVPVKFGPMIIIGRAFAFPHSARSLSALGPVQKGKRFLRLLKILYLSGDFLEQFCCCCFVSSPSWQKKGQPLWGAVWDGNGKHHRREVQFKRDRGFEDCVPR